MVFEANIGKDKRLVRFHMDTELTALVGSGTFVRHLFDQDGNAQEGFVLVVNDFTFEGLCACNTYHKKGKEAKEGF